MVDSPRLVEPPHLSPNMAIIKNLLEKHARERGEREHFPQRPFRHLKFTSFHGPFATHGRAHSPLMVEPIWPLYLVGE